MIKRSIRLLILVTYSRYTRYTTIAASIFVLYCAVPFFQRFSIFDFFNDMSDLQQLLLDEQSYGDSIIKAEIFFKKDSADRKVTLSYFTGKLTYLDNVYNDFCKTASAIDSLDDSHDLTYRNSVFDTYTRYSTLLNDGITKISNNPQPIEKSSDASTSASASKNTRNLVENITTFIENHASTDALKTKLKLTGEKLDEVCAERDALLERCESLQQENSAYVREIEQVRQSNELLESEAHSLREKPSLLDVIQLEHEQLTSSYNALKSNFLRVSRKNRAAKCLIG